MSNFVQDIHLAPWLRDAEVEIGELDKRGKLQISLSFKVLQDTASIDALIGYGDSADVKKATWSKFSRWSGDDYRRNFSHKIQREELGKFWFVKITNNAEPRGQRSFYRRIFFSEVAVHLQDEKRENALFPERDEPAYKDRLDTAVCFSGGGTRAMLLAMGQLRYLTEHKYTEKLGYISSVSGGSWAATSYTFAKTRDREALLGRYVEPQESSKLLNNHDLPQLAQGAKSGQFLATLIGRTIKSVMYAALSSEQGREILAQHFDQQELAKLISNADILSNPSRVWMDAVQECFFGPTLNFPGERTDAETSFALNDTHLQRMADNPGAMQKSIELFHKVNTGLNAGKYPPYYMVNALMLRPLDGRSENYVPFEFSPLYQGAGFNGTWHNNNITVGGAAPAFCFNSKVVGKVKDNRVWVARQGLDANGSLGTASGISSSATAGFTSQFSTDFIFFPLKLIQYWFCQSKTTWSQGLSKANQGVVTGLAEMLEGKEGGEAIIEQELLSQWQQVTGQISSELFDSIGSFICNGLGPLIDQFGELATPQANHFSPNKAVEQLKNQQVLFGDAGLSDNLGLMSMLRRGVKKILVFVNSETEFQSRRRFRSETIDATVPAYFGKVTKASSDGLFGIDLKHLQVFEEEDYKTLLAQFDTAKSKGKSIVARTKHKVKENKLWDIKGGYEVEVLWYYNSKPDSWVKALPDEVQAELKGNPLPFTPTTPGTLAGVSSLTSHLLANIAEYNLRETEAELQNFLSE